MILTSAFASVHYLAFAIGLGSVFMRGVFFRKLIKSSSDVSVLNSLFIADNFWGVAAAFIILTGLTRAFGGLEKPAPYYLHNKMFWIKMTLFVAVFLLEIKPMIFLIRARIALKKKTSLPGFSVLPSLKRFNDIELALIVLIPFAASAMARGIGY